MPKRQVARLRNTIPDAKDRAEIENSFRTTFGQFIGGAVLLTAGLAYYQTQQPLNVTVAEAESSRKATSEQTDKTLRETQLSREAPTSGADLSLAKLSNAHRP